MIEVKTRSLESWGPLSSDKCGDRLFRQIINSRPGETKNTIKNHIKRQKKLKTYKVSFKKEWHSDTFELQAESDWEIGAVARAFFKQNTDSIGFKENPRGKWGGDYDGYDSISYVKARK